MRKCLSSSHTPCTCLQGCTSVLRCTRDNSDNHQTTPHQLHPAYSTTPMSTQQKHFYTAQRIAIPAQMHVEYPNMSTTHQLLTPDTKLSLHKQTAFDEPSPTAETRKSAMYTHMYPYQCKRHTSKLRICKKMRAHKTSSCTQKHKSSKHQWLYITHKYTLLMNCLQHTN